ncbi:hypothetical protein [Pantoea anthophila]|uniref:hypothetical protein n=1 Tax=Pantoea anthophila TaxID=470931 RepID=UPI002DBDDE92|nr:hypothetical protein [Pantoea anthophila]MEB5708447.1 hypothetical protein [Pantoea anthophila]MEB6519319.1 hypothetical protein [Pantoea anthophila]
MQHISLDQVRTFNKTSVRLLHNSEDDCLPEGYSYGSDTEGDNLPDPEQTLSEPVYDPYDDPDSPFFRLPFNDDLPAVTDTIPETLSKTLRGDIVDDDGWCTTDIPEGSQLAAGDVVERCSTEEPLPTWSEHENVEAEDDNARLDDYDQLLF